MTEMFTVKPEPRAPNVEVYIHDTLSQLRSRAREDAVQRWRTALAYTKVYKWPVEGLYAEIHFARRRTTLEIVVHEATHAIFGLAQLRNFDEGITTDITDYGSQANDKEERFCNANGSLAAAIYNELTSRGVL